MRQPRRRERRDAAQRARAVAIERDDARMRQVAVVAAEQLVAAVARQHDRDVAPRHLRDVPRRNRRRVGERLVEVRDQPVEDADAVRLDDELVVVGAEVLGDAARVLELVELPARRSRSRTSSRARRQLAAIRPTTRLESTPPERNAPSGTSLTRCERTASRQHVAQLLRPRPPPMPVNVSVAGICQYRSIVQRGRRCHVSRWPGGSLRTLLEDRAVARRVEERQVVIERVGVEIARQIGRARAAT